MSRAVFLDCDGVLIEERSYLHRGEDVVFIPGAAVALKRLQDAGFKLSIVSNQSGVGRDYFALADVERVNEHLVRTGYGAELEQKSPDQLKQAVVVDDLSGAAEWILSVK